SADGSVYRQRGHDRGGGDAAARAGRPRWPRARGVLAGSERRDALAPGAGGGPARAVGGSVSMRAAPADRRVTASQLRALLARHGLHLSRELGQNFLVDEALARELAERAGACAGCCVIEVGT